MEEAPRLRLLKIIKFDGNVQPLIDFGYEFAEVVSLIKNEELLGNAIYKRGNLSITPKGLIEIERLEKMNGRKYPWIEPQIESKIHPLEKDEVYIPKRQSIRHLFD